GRGWRLGRGLVSRIGNTANIPVTVGPTRVLETTTTATSTAAIAARSGMSYQRRVISGIGTSRKRRPIATHNGMTTMLRARTEVRLHSTERTINASTVHTASAAATLTASGNVCAATA